MRGGGADGLVVAKKPGNAGGAKGPDDSVPRLWSTSDGRSRCLRQSRMRFRSNSSGRRIKRVKANRGAAGVDGESLAMFEKDLKGNLYKIWNRMSSGSYFPPPVRLVEIPKDNGGTRPLGHSDGGRSRGADGREDGPGADGGAVFHPDSYGYRPGKSALDAVGMARKRCWRADWVIDLDIKSVL